MWNSTYTSEWQINLLHSTLNPPLKKIKNIYIIRCICKSQVSAYSAGPRRISSGSGSAWRRSVAPSRGCQVDGIPTWHPPSCGRAEGLGGRENAGDLGNICGEWWENLVDSMEVFPWHGGIPTYHHIMWSLCIINHPVWGIAILGNTWNTHMGVQRSIMFVHIV